MNIHIPNDPEQTARIAIAHYNPRLGEKFAHLIRFLNLHPESGPQRKGSAFPVGSVHYIELLAKRFADGRRGRKPKEPKTVPDNMVSVVLQDYFGCAPADLKRIQKEHRLSMGAENIIGDLLEGIWRTSWNRRDGYGVRVRPPKRLTSSSLQRRQTTSGRHCRSKTGATLRTPLRSLCVMARVSNTGTGRSRIRKKPTGQLSQTPSSRLY